MSIRDYPELRVPLATDLLHVERADGTPRKIALGDLMRFLPELTEKTELANGDLIVVYDATTKLPKYARVAAVAAVPTTTTAAPTTTTAAPTTTTTAGE
jgi:hypothetical protein